MPALGYMGTLWPTSGPSGWSSLSAEEVGRSSPIDLELAKLSFALKECFSGSLSSTETLSSLLGFPRPKAAACDESVLVTVLIWSFALDPGSDGLGAYSFKSSAIFLVSFGALGESTASGVQISAYSMPSCPTEGMCDTLDGLEGASEADIRPFSLRCDAFLPVATKSGSLRGEGA